MIQIPSVSFSVLPASEAVGRDSIDANRKPIIMIQRTIKMTLLYGHPEFFADTGIERS